METPSTMDKKIPPRGSLPPSKNGAELPAKDFTNKKPNQNSGQRKRENDKYDNVRKQANSRGGRAGQRYVRPREKTGGQVNIDERSLYHGGKKQNITHLVTDWWGPSPGEKGGRHHTDTWPAKGGARQKKSFGACHKYSKEHFLQANCQFIVKAGEDYTVYEHDPDILVDWNLVEEVRLHMSVALNCPICLHPPTAAKVTRCGHIYCYSCILHYLALSDDDWRKCPICDAEIVKDDLKSGVCVVHEDYQLGEEVKLQLMRRERDSLVAIPVCEFTGTKDKKAVQMLENYHAIPSYNKLITATISKVNETILAREERELNEQLSIEGDQPEACFIEEALKFLNERKLSLSSLDNELAKLTIVENESTIGQNPIKYPDKNSNKLKTSLSMDDCDTNENIPVMAEDLDISQLQPLGVTSSNITGQKNPPKPTFYFYQAINGGHIYLHALNVQMLVHEYGSLDKCPPIITGKILDKETVAMTEDLRNRLRYLRHLPVTCNFDVVELGLDETVISTSTLNEFKAKIEAKQRKRNKRAKEERKIERRVQAEEDRMWGRTKGMKISVNSSSHFPTFQDLNTTPSSPPPNDPVLDASARTSSPINSSIDSDASASAPSFAQMIRDHPPVEERNVWPSLGNTSSMNTPPTGWNTQPSRTRRSTECSEDDPDEGAAAPEFRLSYSNDFARLIDEYGKNKVTSEPVSKGKKKKLKGVTIFSTGRM